MLIGPNLYTRTSNRVCRNRRKAGRTQLRVVQLEIREAPAVFIVTNTLDSGAGSFRQAVIDANAMGGADSIEFQSGLSGEIQLTSGEITISDPLTVTGPGAGVLTLRGINNTTGLFTTTAATTFSGLRITGGHANANVFDRHGGAINSQAALTLRDCIFTGNSAGDPFDKTNGKAAGGAVYHTGDNLLVERCQFLTNGASDGTLFPGSVGGAIAGASGTIVIRDSYFYDNSATSGAAVSAGGTFEGCLFEGNTGYAKYGQGGAIAGGSVTARNCTFFGNVSSYGGAISGSGLLQNCTITGNSVFDLPNFSGGSGLFGSTWVLESTIISGNMNHADVVGNSVSIKNCARGGIASPNITDFGGNLPSGTDLKLGSLAENGGLTQTIALLPGSPCINAGFNPSGLPFDQRGVGFPRVISKSADIGAFEVQGLPPAITSIQVNDGAAQRSMVNSLTVEFDRVVTLPANPADAFEFKRQSDDAIVSLKAGVIGNTVLLTFTGGPVQFGSLADGRYTLTAFASKIDAGNFDGNGDGTAGDDFVLIGTPANGFFRLFGDADGNGTVNTADFTALRSAFGGVSPIFDFNNTGTVDTTDFDQFRARFGSSV